MSFENRRKGSALIVALLALCLAAATVLPSASASDGSTATIAKKKCKKKGKSRAAAAKKKCKKKHGTSSTPASIVPTPASHDFGTQLPGSTTKFNFTLTNPGDGEVSPVYLTSTASDGFADFIPNLAPPVLHTCVQGIPAHSSCEIEVNFKAPPTPGPVSGTVTVDDHLGHSVVIPVSGTTGL
jgi:hypothetical protein